MLDGFQNEDALLVPHFHSKAKTLKEAQAGEHAQERALKFYTSRIWPKCDVIVGNPPFLGDKVMRRELGDHYVSELRRVYGASVPGQSDLCCYWFEKARRSIELHNCQRAGLLATQGIRHGANREVLKRIKETGDIFFAVSDREWVLSGANVNVSIVGFDNGTESSRALDGRIVEVIHPNLTSSGTKKLDLTLAKPLATNKALCFVGVMKGGPFELDERFGLGLLKEPNSHHKPNSDILRPRVTASDILRRGKPGWIIDFGLDTSQANCAQYEAPWKYAVDVIKPVRHLNRRKRMAVKWWIHGEARPGMRRKLSGLSRVLVTPEVSKHRIFTWLPPVFLPDHKLRAIATESDYWFGILHSHLHELWALRLGSRLQTRPCYTPTTCFETFPFPFAEDLQSTISPPQAEPGPESGWEQVLERRFYTIREEPPAYGGGGAPRQPTPGQHRAAIAAAAKELNELRERWLNPPEWTVEKTLEFPGSSDGPWARYVVHPDKNGLGTVRYPRLEPRDADCAARLKKRTLTELYNQRQRGDGEAAWLDFAHQKLDAAVAAAYGFPADLADEEILERLLALNLERAEEEAETNGQPARPSQREKNAGEMV